MPTHAFFFFFALLPASVSPALALPDLYSSLSSEQVDECGPTPDPERHELPLDAVVDSAALLAGLEAFWRPGWGAAYATIRYDSLGLYDRSSIYVEDLPEEASDRLEALVESHLRSTVREEKDFRLPVQLVRGDVVAPMARARFRTCRPQMRNTDEVARELRRLASSYGKARRTASGVRVEAPVHGVVELYVFVDREGEPGEIRIAESSGDHRLDRVARRAIRKARFDPARVEGVATGVWISMPLRVRIGR